MRTIATGSTAGTLRADGLPGAAALAEAFRRVAVAEAMRSNRQLTPDDIADAIRAARLSR